MEENIGMEVFLVDILRQSSENIGGIKEAMFTSHIENDEDRPQSVLTAIFLLIKSSTLRKVCGKISIRKMVGYTQ